MYDGTACPVCRRDAITDVVAELEVSEAMMPGGGPMPGYAWLLFRRHAVELHDLSADEGAAFMRDVQRLSRAIAVATGAVKMNYEVHGNTVPHLHMHFFPRYVGDPFEGGPIDPRAAVGPARAPREHAELRRHVAAALAAALSRAPGAARR